MKKRSIHIGILSLTVGIFLGGCQPATPPQTPVKKPSVSTPQTGQNMPQKNIALKSESFAGSVHIRANDVEKTENGFLIPVFLKGVTKDDLLDTLSLRMILPSGVQLDEVQTSSGFTAQLDGIGSSTPTVHYLSSSLTADSYEPIMSKDEALMHLVFTGEIPRSISLKASFFQTTGSLSHSPALILSLE